MDSNTNSLKLYKDINENKNLFKENLPIGKSFDIVGRDLLVGGKEAYLIFIDGFAKDDMLFILEELQNTEYEDIKQDTITTLIKRKIAYLEVEGFTRS